MYVSPALRPTPALRQMITSWFDKAAGVFAVPDPSAAARTLALEALQGRRECDTVVLFADVPDGLAVRHVVGTVQHRPCDQTMFRDHVWDRQWFVEDGSLAIHSLLGRFGRVVRPFC